MTAGELNLLIAFFAALAAVLWALSALVPVPRISSTQQAIQAGTGISMHQMNDDAYAIAVAMKKQSRLSQWAAGCAAVAAIVQAASVFLAP